MPSTYTKDPGAALDYGVNWSLWLGTDTISASGWVARRAEGDTAPAATTETPDLGILATPAASFDTKSTRVWVNGGVVGAVYDLTNRISTAGGRVDERTVKIAIRQR